LERGTFFSRQIAGDERWEVAGASVPKAEVAGTPKKYPSKLKNSIDELAGNGGPTISMPSPPQRDHDDDEGDDGVGGVVVSECPGIDGHRRRVNGDNLAQRSGAVVHGSGRRDDDDDNNDDDNCNGNEQWGKATVTAVAAMATAIADVAALAEKATATAAAMTATMATTAAAATVMVMTTAMMPTMMKRTAVMMMT
jgi:hypothetical protein